MAISKDEIIKAIESMTVLELSELVKALEEKFGVSAAAPAAAAIPSTATVSVSVVEEKTEFDVVLVDSGAQKINVIKEIRAITGLGLKEAKELADNPPKTIKEGVAKAEAEELKQKLTAAGAKVELK